MCVYIYIYTHTYNSIIPIKMIGLFVYRATLLPRLSVLCFKT